MTLFDYIEQHSSPENEVLSQITRNTYLEILNPHMLSGRVQGRVLSMMSQMIHPKCIVELGTFTGYSALCLAEGLTENGKLYTLEHNDELEDTIRQHFSLSPLGEKIELIIGDAKETLRRLPLAFGSVDLSFIDADKREYCEYIELIYPFMRRGGWILADNTLWDGHIIDPAYDKDKQTLGLRTFNDKIAADPRFEQVILPLRDGLTIIHVL